MYATTPVLFTALVALIHTAIAQPPPTCQPGETPHVSLDIPEWGQVISLDKNQHDEYQFWGHASTSFAFNVDQANPYTTEHFIYNVYDDTRGPWTQQYNEQIKIKHIYDVSAGHLSAAVELMSSAGSRPPRA